MARQSKHLATICPADLIAETNAICDEDFALFDAYPSQLNLLHYAIIRAVAPLLPDELILAPDPRADDETPLWNVLQALDPATTHDGAWGVQDAATSALLADIAWLSDLRAVAERINLPALVRTAIQNAEGVRLANA